MNSLKAPGLHNDTSRTEIRPIKGDAKASEGQTNFALRRLQLGCGNRFIFSQAYLPHMDKEHGMFMSSILRR